MRNIWSDIAAHEREVEAFAERLELRIHAVALIVTALVLGMRLWAGAGDLVGDTSSAEQGSADVAATPSYGL
jgi:hypothetical protein